MRTRLSLVLLAGLLGTSSAWAQIRKGSNLVGFSVGTAIPMDPEDFDQETGSGLGVGAGFIHFLKPSVGLGVQMDYFSLGKTSAGPLELKTNVLSIQGMSRFNLLPERDIIPYFLIGFGFNRFNQDLESTSGSLNDSFDSTGLGLSFGGGFEALLTDVLGLGFEARYHHFLTDENDIGYDNAQILSAQVRLNWHLKAKHFRR